LLSVTIYPSVRLLDVTEVTASSCRVDAEDTLDESLRTLADAGVLHWTANFPEWSLTLRLLPPGSKDPAVAIKVKAMLAFSACNLTGEWRVGLDRALTRGTGGGRLVGMHATGDGGTYDGE